ncbi:MAG: hypothetical protein RIT24_2946 [Planctomycetota bacterium]
MASSDPASASSSGPTALSPQLIELVYGELRALASSYMRQQRSSHTLQPTALVNEAFLKIARGNNDVFASRSHFMAVAATAMRQVLINHAEAKNAEKRGGGHRGIPIDPGMAAPDLGISQVDVLAIDEGLRKLEKLDERKARVVEAKIFGGLSHEEIATVLGVSLSTVEADWRMAKAWLAKEMKGAK